MPLKEAEIDTVESVAVMIVDDQEPFRAVARIVVGLSPGFRLIAEAGSGEAAVSTAAEERPALVLMDINLPGINGIEATRQILRNAPHTVIVLLSTYEAAELPADATECGAARYVNKEDFSPAVLREVWAASRLA